jgi:nitroreductase
MGFEELLDKRRSIRAFDSKPFPEEYLQRILEAVRIAPTAGNVQAFRMKIVRDKETKEKLVPACRGQAFIADAPFIIAFFSSPQESKDKYGTRGEKLYSVQDATIAIYTAHLMAAELGLGSCWIGAFSESEVSKVLNIADDLVPVGLLPVGYAKEEPQQRKRKTISELIIKE